MIEITLLTQPACELCEQAKRVVAALGAEMELVVVEISVDSEQGRRTAEAAGFAFAPGVLVDGEPFSYGRLSERKLRRALAAKATAAG